MANPYIWVLNGALHDTEMVVLETSMG